MWVPELERGTPGNWPRPSRTSTRSIYPSFQVHPQQVLPWKNTSLLPRAVSPVQSEGDGYANEQSFSRAGWETDHLPGVVSY